MHTERWLQRFLLRFRTSPGVSWCVLLALSVVLVFALTAAHIPAAILLGPMMAAVAVAAAEGAARSPDRPFKFSQAIVGCLVAQSIPASVFPELARDWPIFLIGVFSSMIAAAVLGWLLTRWRILPGSTAIWGMSPGAATAMILISESYGGDIRLVAFMQYLRVGCIASVASVVAMLWAQGSGGPPPPAAAWFPPVAWDRFAGTLLVAVAGLAIAKTFRISGGNVIVPMAIGIVLQATGLLSLELPQWLLTPSYAMVGWNIGLRFTRRILEHVSKAFTRVLVSILALIVFCGAFAAVLVVWAGIDPLTAYLATSPGGADSIAIIAASSAVDMPFVMAMQTARLILVILTGPALARFVASVSGVAQNGE